MVVPSLSWQNDGISGVKWHRKKTRSLTCKLVLEIRPIDLRIGDRSGLRDVRRRHPEKTAAVFECFSYVCPEPVLAK